MHKVSRTLLLAGVMAFGTLTAACGDKVTVAPPALGISGIQSITVTPTTASVTAGQSIQLAVSVVADAATAKTVTWASSNSAVATVDQTGKVTGVVAGAVTITATATADATKAAAASVTVLGAVSPTPAAIAISALNQGNIPAQLGNVAGQLDVVLFVSGPSGVINLIQNCTAGGATSTTGDVIVAQQNFAGSPNQAPVTLSYNTAATGAVVNGIAVPSATSTTPLYLNGNCVVKATLATSAGAALATAVYLSPITLNNASFFRTAMVTSGPSQISNVNGLNYVSGDVTFTLTPVNYVSATPLASISGTFAGRNFTLVTPAAGTQTFTVTFPSAIVAQGTAVPANSISDYTSANAGDNLQVTSSVTTGGANSFVGAFPTFGPVRVDNSPNNLAVQGGAANPSGAQIVPTTNWVNGAYTFTSGLLATTDSLQTSNSGTGGVTVTIGVGPSTITALTGNTNYPNIPATALPTTGGNGIGATQCSQAGFTTAVNGSTLANSLPGVSTTYRARAFWTDKIGNQRCQDLIGSPLAANANGFFGVDLNAPLITKTGGPVTGPTSPASTAPVIVTGVADTFFPIDSISGFVLNRQFRYSLYRTFTISTANCVPIIDGVNATQTGTGANGCTGTANSAPSVILDGNTNVAGYYNLTANSIDQAGNVSATLSFINLLDAIAPIVQGISIPQNLVGGTSVTFTSTATDNVDLASTNFNITYTAGSGTPTLFYPGSSYGTKYTAANVTTSAAVTANVPFFIQQVQGTAAVACPAGPPAQPAGVACGAPVAFTAADSGEAQTVAVRAVDAAFNVSAASTAAIPNLNISGAAGFTAGTQFDSFEETNAAVNISNGTGTVNPKTVTLSAAAILSSATAQNATVPFNQVCFYYQANAVDVTIPNLSLVQIGCISAPSITDIAGISRTWTYQLTGFDPPAAMGTANPLPIFAIGVKTNGVGIISQVNNNIALTN